ncbi:hypothetical protein Athai_49710 [Actinocatenispora thailandica]|uniref:Uncharacterized protein n=1 Tax=Actinocatenispora thailandica TaxID=227318 RepID=A0A7R7DTE0_9ACTN|nr:hypothetical protein [Actinocatenispora thailandica]BCJ37468.1 hypothetical protein Athai_49710 [Actinocatenispora thailandica]
MRHLSSFIAGIVVAIVAWGVLGWAQAKLGATAVAGISSHNWGTYSWPLLFLAIGGLLIGLIASTRISPSGPLIAGIGYLVLQALYVQWPGFLNWLPHSVFGQTDIWTRPARSGLFAVLGLAMLVAVASVRRWQRWPSRTGTGAHAPGRTGASAGAGSGLGDTTDRQFPLSGSRSGSLTTDTGMSQPSGAEDPTRAMPAQQPSGDDPAGGPSIGRPPEPPH